MKVQNYQNPELNPFQSNEISLSYQLDQSIFYLNGCWVVFSIVIRILIEHLVANSGYPDQTPHFTASDLDLHCLSHKKEAKLTLVKILAVLTISRLNVQFS